MTLHGKTATGITERSSRTVPPKMMAQVFRRDEFLCSYCGGRTIPRNVRVPLSDALPDALPYYRHYARGTVHPAYWVLVPGADHALAHAYGGSSEIDNLTTMHAMCNTPKSSLAVEDLPEVARVPPAADRWDGLISRYADIVIAGGTRGRRHSRDGYHMAWLRHYGLAEEHDRARAITGNC